MYYNEIKYLITIISTYIEKRLCKKKHKNTKTCYFEQCHNSKVFVNILFSFSSEQKINITVTFDHLTTNPKHFLQSFSILSLDKYSRSRAKGMKTR